MSRPGALLLTPTSWRCVHGRPGWSRRSDLEASLGNAVFAKYRIMSGESRSGEGFMTDDQAKEIVSAARAFVFVAAVDSE